MPGGGKKAVFPPLNLHDHDSARISANDQDRQKKFLQNRGKSLELKEVLEKEKNDGPNKNKNKAQSSGSKSDHQKTPTKSEQKAFLKLEQQQIKSDQKAQQKFEKEQQKMEKEQQKEYLKLEKEQLKLEKGAMKLEKEQKSKASLRSQMKAGDHFTSLKENPQLKTQKSMDLSFLKHQKSMESPRPPARKSVDMQYGQDLLDSSSFSPIQLKSKK